MKVLMNITAVTFLVLLNGCGDSSDSVSEVTATVIDTKEKLGEALFFDANISFSRKMSCATCHNPDYGFVDARFRESGVDQSIFIDGAFSVGDDGFSLGGRNAPTAAYAMYTPTFSQMQDGNYFGGEFHDGRAATLKVQAGGPPLDGAEMQMPDKRSVIERVQENKVYIEAFKLLFPDTMFDDINGSYENMTEAISKFEKTDLFAPFNSKYDKFRECVNAGNGEFGCYTTAGWSEEAIAGYALFTTNNNTSCMDCHSLNSGFEATQKELFTNYKYENIGTPRNITAMDARANLGLQDMNATFQGLGKTVNNALHNGKTKVPTLRNIAITGPYMSNGVFKKLRTVLEFYDHMGENTHNLHEVNPETGDVWGINDYPETVNHTLLSQPFMSDKKIMQLEAFLNTLTDKQYEHLIPELAPEGALGN